MPSLAKRWLFLGLAAITTIYLYLPSSALPSFKGLHISNSQGHPKPSTTKWQDAPKRYPVSSYRPLPTGRLQKLPKIQHTFPKIEADDVRERRLPRQKAVKEAMKHSWKGYREHAWGKDEVAPITGGHADKFGGWAATLVDSLDTLWIMGMREEFNEAVKAAVAIDFSTSVDETVNVFETTIRYLGGFLAAYDLSGEEVLLEKAAEIGEMLYVAFDTPNRMPVPRWKWADGMHGVPQETTHHAISAEVGSLCLEFTRLSQLTGDMRYYDAIARITDIFYTQQDKSALPGMWPVIINVAGEDFHSNYDFSLGAMADSLYEYLPKMHMLLGGAIGTYQTMYEKAFIAAEKHLFYAPLNPENKDLLISGQVRATEGGLELDPSGQHLVCFVGGMVGIAGKIFEHDADLIVARKLTDGCIWAYESMASGIAPEIYHTVPCEKQTNIDCTWNEELWKNATLRKHYGSGPTRGETADDIIKNGHLAPGFTEVHDTRYILRPEAIESVLILYRITGDETLMDKGWKMFEAIVKACKTDVAFAAVWGVDSEHPKQVDSMESFWTAETLKYFYLLFSEPDLVSLDEYVFNTEAHPFRRPTVASGWFG